MDTSTSFWIKDKFLFSYLEKSTQTEMWYLSMLQDGSSLTIYFKNKEQVINFLEDIEKSVREMKHETL
jgi:outer membrane lipoprotein-sorting protein